MSVWVIGNLQNECGTESERDVSHDRGERIYGKVHQDSAIDVYFESNRLNERANKLYSHNMRIGLSRITCHFCFACEMVM